MIAHHFGKHWSPAALTMKTATGTEGCVNVQIIVNTGNSATIVLTAGTLTSAAAGLAGTIDSTGTAQDNGMRSSRKCCSAFFMLRTLLLILLRG